MRRKRANGGGTIYLRKDGRYEAAMYLLTMSGQRKRIRVYGKTYMEAQGKLADLTAQAAQRLPVSDQRTKLADYLDYWLDQFVKPNRRPKTYEQYEMVVRLYLKPGLGSRSLNSLSVPLVQAFLNEQLKAGRSVRAVQIIRTTLSAVLTRAQREELVSRNVARLVELPQWQRQEIYPWSKDEAMCFLTAAKSHRLYPAFLLLVLYGMRRGEVLGLRWQDIDFERDELHIRQQLQRVGRELITVPVKTRAGERTLPLLPAIRTALLAYQQEQATVQHDGLVFTTSNDTPIEPRNFVRSFWRICEAHGVRVIKLHHIRHTAATLLKDIGAPARDAQLILGHASPWTTSQIYQHDNLASRREQIGKLEQLLVRPPEEEPHVG